MKAALNRKEIAHICKKGTRYTHNGLTLICQKENEESNKRYAILISKKIIKNNAKRNRMRRVIRETFNTTAIHGTCVLIHTNKNSTEEEIQKNIMHLAEKLP